MFFQAAFVLIACLIAAKLLFGRDSWTLGSELPGNAAMNAYGFAIGLGSSLMGISGGSLVTMTLTLYGKPIHSSVATAAGLGVPITLVGTIGYVPGGAAASRGTAIAVPRLRLDHRRLLIAPLSSWIAPFGARLAHRSPKRRLEIAFGVFLLLVASRFVVALAATI